MSEKVSPFVWVDALCTKKGDPMGEYGEDEYPTFMVNRSMSQYQDCLFHAAEINLYPDMLAKQAYDYYWFAIRAKKRFGKWGKKKNVGDVALIMDHYQVNRVRAEEILRVLTPEQVQVIGDLQKEREKG